MLERLSTAFPRAGLAVTGSVARGTHTASSDLDLIAVDEGFPREMQLSAESHGVPVAIVFLHPSVRPEREREWMVACGNSGALMEMVRSAMVFSDPVGQFGELQAVVEQIRAARVQCRGELLAYVSETADGLLGRPGAEAPRPQALLRVMGLVIEGWALRAGAAVETKNESRRVFASIADTDPALAELLRAALPITADSRHSLERAVHLVFSPISGF